MSTPNLPRSAQIHEADAYDPRRFAIDYKPFGPDDDCSVQVNGNLTHDGEFENIDLLMYNDMIRTAEARKLAAALLNAADEVDRLSGGDPQSCGRQCVKARGDDSVS